MNADNASPLETDPRFPSGSWAGYFLDRRVPGKHQMELRLTFQVGVMKGEGRDSVGTFLVSGRYHLGDGKCYWTKTYVGKHDVYYEGFNEGKGIWGFWEVEFHGLKARGGFDIWPEGMGDPTDDHLAEEATPPIEEPVETDIKVGA